MHLLQCLRGSPEARLRALPFTLIVADIKDHDDRENDLARGVAGFITKSMKKAEIVAYVRALLAASDKRRADADAALAEPLDHAKFEALLSTLSFPETGREPACALVFAIDNRELLISRFGEGVAQMIDARFASLLVARVGLLDLIGRCGDARLAIVTHGVDLRQGMRFGRQVCKSLAAGSITIRGERVRLTASVGVASTSADAAATGSELLALAEQRLLQALMCGGNVVAADYRPACPLCWDGTAASSRARIGTLGLKILPLLQAIDEELVLGLPLEKIREDLRQRAMRELWQS